VSIPLDSVGMTDRPSSADLDAAAVDLLLAVIRARPGTFEQLQAVAGHRPAELIDVLIGAGAVRVDGDVVTVPPAAELLARDLDTELSATRERLDRIERVVERLPDLLAAEAGAVVPGRPAVEIIHGSDQVWESWSRYANERPPRRPGNSNNDLRVIREQVLPRLEEVRADFVARGYTMRVLTTVEEASRPGNAEAIPELLGIGVEVRVSPAVPGWFYVDDGIVAAIPLEWGAGGPVNGMAVIHDPSIISMLSHYFEGLWAAARPLPLAQHGWESVLELLAQGRTDEQIADTLGIGLRTVRRRIAEAMDDLGALGRFELGMAWARYLDGNG
jgi:Response regulator containing a CheY-like receiver domain and an HTH DNA-binding domain